eukprot:TRINITY_DN2437_c0_g2_i2.p1 TRINITY_DN2437_c0_g2~~TRINITY_DN2437_c0_g2_i2.p1  ORF type:complete len:549 (-),score=144.30 TRINITY_DN2437_c0_g2_i2:755-2368(-)
MSHISSHDISLSQEQITPVELVLFYGPPCSGKTRFYYQEYSQTHTRISPRDDYPDKSLHHVVSEAIKLLREGTQVVIDDCNAHEDTRQSYIARVKEAVPHTRTVLVVFRPVHGVRQCEWQLEWNLAARCNVTQRDTNQADQHGTYIDWSAWQKTFEHEPVSLLEGFNSTRYVDSRLYAARPREQFNNAALIIEAQALVEYSMDALCQVKCALQPHVSSVLREWSGGHGAWRVVVLVDESALYPMSIELIEDPELQISVIQQCRTALQQQLTALQLHKPVYYLLSEYNSFEQTHFFKLQRGGMIAWAHMRHGLALPQCVYVTATPKNKPVSAPCGLKYCHAADLFNNNGWGTDSKLRKYTREQASPSTTELLSDVEYSDVPVKSTEPLQLSSASGEWTINTEQGGFGRVHGCCWPGSIAVSNELPVPIAPLVDRDYQATPPRKSRALPEWLSPNNNNNNNNARIKEKPKKAVEKQVLPDGTEDDPISQDLQPSQSSLFDNLSASQDSEDEATNENKQTKRKRSEDEPSDEIKPKKAKI